MVWSLGVLEFRSLDNSVEVGNSDNGVGIGILTIISEDGQKRIYQESGGSDSWRAVAHDPIRPVVRP